MRTFFRPAIPLFLSLAFMAVAAFFAMNSQNNPLFWVVGMTASAIIVSIVWSFLTMRPLEVRRLDPKHGVVGEPLVIRYAVTNRGRFLPAFNVVIEEDAHRGRSNWPDYMAPAPAWVLHIGPGETVHGEAVTWPQARGEVRFDRLRHWSRFPFGLVRRLKSRAQPTHTLIFPRLYRLRPGVLDAVIPAGPLGMKLTARSGGGDDFFGLREYRPGDSRRQIAWKRSAGSDTLIIMERTQPSPPRIRIILNLAVPTARLTVDPRPGVSPRALEERAISLAATMVEHAYHGGYEVGLSVLGAPVPVTPLRCSHWHVEKIMAALASIDLEAARTPVDSRALADAERAGIVVIHPRPVDPSIVRVEAWHFSATQLERLVETGTPSPRTAAAARESAVHHAPADRQEAAP